MFWLEGTDLVIKFFIQSTAFLLEYSILLAIHKCLLMPCLIVVVLPPNLSMVGNTPRRSTLRSSIVRDRSRLSLTRLTTWRLRRKWWSPTIEVKRLAEKSRRTHTRFVVGVKTTVVVQRNFSDWCWPYVVLCLVPGVPLRSLTPPPIEADLFALSTELGLHSHLVMLYPPHFNLSKW